MGKKISVIVPVYNSAPYLNFCVESVLRQTWADFELLLIADGPTDGSEKLCEELARRDRRIRFLPRPHQGVSAARNAGLEEAEGEYVFFLDSDDAIHPRLLERLLELAERTRAVVTAVGILELPTERFEKSVDQLCVSDEELPGKKYRYLNQEEALDRLLTKPSKEQMYAIGGKLIRGSAARKDRFDGTLSNGEDTKYVYQLLADGAETAVLFEDGYYYRAHRRGQSKERTVSICKSIYECSRYICLRERAEGREMSSLRWEEDILRNIALWHVEAHVKGNSALNQYTLELRDETRGFVRNGQTGWETKIGYFLAFHCCLAYRLCYAVYKIWRYLRRSGDDFCQGFGS